MALIAAIYARKSTEQAIADEHRSVARQVAHAREYAAKRGWIVDDGCVFVDDGISGAEFAKRPGFLRLMNALRPRPPFQVLVMSEESRLGRESIETAYALKQIILASVRVFFYLEDRERTITSPTDKLLVSVSSYADEMERERSRQRTYDALARKAQAGLVTGGRCFGYRNKRETSGVRREIEPSEAAVVRRIFELAALGTGYKGISKRLNDEGALCPRPQQGRPAGWAPSSVREILKRSIYRGQVIWNQSQKRDSWGQQRRKSRPESQWMCVPAPDLRIVNDELWNTVQTQLQNQHAARRGPIAYQGAKRAKTTYLLTGFLRCGLCGAGMEVRRQKHGRVRVTILHCSAHWRKGKTICGNYRTVVMADAERAILNAIQDRLLNPKVIEPAVKLAAVRLTSDDGSREHASQELRRLEVELQRLATAIAGGADVATLVEAMRSREERCRELRLQLQVVRGRPVVDVRAVLNDLRVRLSDWRELLRSSIPEARSLLRLLIVDRLKMEPTPKGYRFSGLGTVVPILEQAGLPTARFEWRPHADTPSRWRRHIVREVVRELRAA
jgi:site-specific DNA recombinase